MEFTNLEQRMLHVYLDMLPPFIPWEGAPVSTRSQEQFYTFLHRMYQILFDKPELLFSKLNPDDAYPNRFNKASYGNPKLYNAMQKELTVIDGFIMQLFVLGQMGSVEGDQLALPEGLEIKKKLHGIFPSLGLHLDGSRLACAEFNEIFPAWVWMASRESANTTTFARGMFDPRAPNMQQVYARLFGDQAAFDRLAAYLNQAGYRRAELLRGPFTLDYFKPIKKKEAPLGNPLLGDPNHYGISAEYKPDVAVPQFMVLRILEMKHLLLKFEQMTERLKAFVVRTVKHCDNCGYCTQTDKTGKRQPVFITITYQGQELRLCPLYASYSFCFSEVNEELVEDLIAFLKFMDDHFKG